MLYWRVFFLGVGSFLQYLFGNNFIFLPDGEQFGSPVSQSVQEPGWGRNRAGKVSASICIHSRLSLLFLGFYPIFKFICYSLVWIFSTLAFSEINLLVNCQRPRGEIWGIQIFIILIFHLSVCPYFQRHVISPVPERFIGILGHRLISSFFLSCFRVQFSWQTTKSCFLADKFCCPCLFFLSFYFLAFNSK